MMDNHRGFWRGKRIIVDELAGEQCGEWVIGYYVCLNGEEHRIYNGYAETDCGEYYPDCYSVDPETLGKCTGLCDKNGEPIFEGDIIKNSYGETFTVSYVDEYACFGVTCKGRFFRMYALDLKRFEIIGNIHDSPELLSATGEASDMR